MRVCGFIKGQKLQYRGREACSSVYTLNWSIVNARHADGIKVHRWLPIHEKHEACTLEYTTISLTSHIIENFFRLTKSGANIQISLGGGGGGRLKEEA